MEKLRTIVEHYHRWQPLDIYIERIEAHAETDFSLALENAKALLESIAKEICEHNNVEIGSSIKFQALLKKAFLF